MFYLTTNDNDLLQAKYKHKYQNITLALKLMYNILLITNIKILT